jgi:hypothetical protein
MSPSNEFKTLLDKALAEVRETLVSKNAGYGDSWCNAEQVFSKVSSRERLLVRLDEKIRRVRNLGSHDTEDTFKDILGYLTLVRMLDMRYKK